MDDTYLTPASFGNQPDIRLWYVPFVPNESDRCVPATFGAMARYFRPDLASELTDEALDEICNYRPGHGAPGVPALLKLSRLGLEPLWIEDIGHRTLLDLSTPQGYKAFVRDTTPSDEAYEQQMAMTDIPAICTHIEEYARRGLPFKNAVGTLDMAKKLVKSHLVKLMIDSNKLRAPKEQALWPPLPHSITAVGYGAWRFEDGTTTKVLLCHDANSETGNFPYRPIPLPKLAAARRAFNTRRQIMALRPSPGWRRAAEYDRLMALRPPVDCATRYTLADAIEDSLIKKNYRGADLHTLFTWEQGT